MTVNPLITDLWDTGAPAAALNGTAYVEEIFTTRVAAILANASASSGKTYLHWTPHSIHCPLQIPREWLARYRKLTGDDETGCSAQTAYIFPGSTTADYACRAQYQAMVGYLDESIGNVTAYLKSSGLWDETLIVLTSDNGGPLDLAESGANSHPLRGGKYSDFEGAWRGACVGAGRACRAVGMETRGGPRLWRGRVECSGV